MASPLDPSSSCELLKFPEGEPTPDLVRRIEACLKAGQIVGIPTETVYGLMVRADSPEGLERLIDLKGRDPKQALTWHVGSPRAIQSFGSLTPLVQRLSARYWPGPLSLVLEGVPPGLEQVARDGWTGVRLPAHVGLAALIQELEFPVVASSANLSGQAPAVTAGRVAELFKDQIALILDGGECRLAEPSGVLKVGPGHFQLLREGLLPLVDLRRTAGLHIGFVCTGNTCRSPMAEGLARHLLQTRLGVHKQTRPVGASAETIGDFGFEVSSMGVSAGPGAPASGHSVDVLASEGIDISKHCSRPAIPEDVLQLDLVYGLTRAHLQVLRASLPPGKDTGLHLLEPDGRDIPDPFGGSRRDYLRAFEAIRAAIDERSKAWA